MTELLLKSYPKAQTYPALRSVVMSAYTTSFSHNKEHLNHIFLIRSGLTNNGEVNRMSRGAFYPNMSPKMLATQIIQPAREWTEIIDHPVAEVKTRIFRTNLPGVTGMVELAKIHPETPVFLAPPSKDDNLLPLVVMNMEQTLSPYTTVIVDVMDPKKPILIMLHPGDLLPKFEPRLNAVRPDQRLMTATQAMALGFLYAKAVSSFKA